MPECCRIVVTRSGRAGIQGFPFLRHIAAAMQVAGSQYKSLDLSFDCNFLEALLIIPRKMGALSFISFSNSSNEKCIMLSLDVCLNKIGFFVEHIKQHSLSTSFCILSTMNGFIFSCFPVVLAISLYVPLTITLLI